MHFLQLIQTIGSGDLRKISRKIDELTLKGFNIREKVGGAGILRNALRKMNACRLDSEVKLEVLKLLVNKGADINESYRSEIMDPYDNKNMVQFKTPLLNVFLTNRYPIDFLRFFLEKGATVNGHLTPYLDSPLHHAILVGNTERVRLLLNASADPNAQDIIHSTPLMEAIQGDAESRQALIILMLEQPSLDLTLKDDEGKTALDYAKEKGDESTVDAIERLDQSRRAPVGRPVRYRTEPERFNHAKEARRDQVLHEVKKPKSKTSTIMF